MKTPHDDETTSVNDEPVVGDAFVNENDEAVVGDAFVNENEPPAIEEPVVVGYSEADFEAMLGSYQDLALHVVLGDDQPDGDRARARVGRYERRDP